jgi:putative transposase
LCIALSRFVALNVVRAYESVREARASIGRYFDFYNGRRPHASLDGNTPDQAYFSPLPFRMAA